jgi:hypothetical protein
VHLAEGGIFVNCSILAVIDLGVVRKREIMSMRSVGEKLAFSNKVNYYSFPKG